MKHTKEPWKVHLLDRRTMIASDVENGYLAETRHIHSGNIEEDNAKRIVACVNACAGITNEALEKGVVKGCIEIVGNETNKTKETPDMWMGVKVWEEE